MLYYLYSAMGKGYYIKQDKRDGLTLNVKKAEFIQYLQGLQGDWIRFKIYERDIIAANGLTYNMELIERKEQHNNQGAAETGRTPKPTPHPTNKVDK